MLCLTRVFRGSAVTAKEVEQIKNCTKLERRGCGKKEGYRIGYRNRWKKTDRKHCKNKKVRAGRRLLGLCNHGKGER